MRGQERRGCSKNTTLSYVVGVVTTRAEKARLRGQGRAWWRSAGLASAPGLDPDESQDRLPDRLVE